MGKSLHSNYKGTIGELAVRQELLKQGYKVYIPEVDIDHVDLIVELSNGAFQRVQCVKYVNSGRVDVVAVYYTPINKCAFVPYNNEKMLSLALQTAKNNQSSKRVWFYQYEEYPEFS